MNAGNRENFNLAGEGGRWMVGDLHYPHGTDPQGLVVYAHGINGFKDWGGMNLVAEKFAAGGFVFVKFNFSHNGTTPENPEEFIDPEAFGHDNYLGRQRDLRRIFDYLSQNERGFRSLPFFLIGHSRGGTDAILYARSDARVKKLITWAAVAEAKTPWRKWDQAEMQNWRENGVRFLKNGRTGQDLPVYYQLYEEFLKHKVQLDVESAARSMAIPWLIVHGDQDESVFVKDAYQLKEWQPEAEVSIIAATGHTFNRSHPWQKTQLPRATEELISCSLQFLRSK